jgi:nucleoside phosphorylase
LTKSNCLDQTCNLYNKCKIDDFLDFSVGYFTNAGTTKNCLSDLKVWIGCSKNCDLSKKIKSIYECVLKSLGVTIVDIDIEGIILEKHNYDALLMFTLTPGISARAIELVVTAKHKKQNKIKTEKLYINMPDEFKEGYITRKLENYNLKYWKYDEFLEEPVFKYILRKLTNIANDKEEEMNINNITYEPEILILTALDKEFQAMEDVLSQDENSPREDPQLGSDRTLYPHYKIGNKDAVLAKTGMGNNKASAITTKMHTTYPSIKYIIMVGIAGGIPNCNDAMKHIRLGDIVLSGEKGIIQHDMGKNTQKGSFEYNFEPRPPNFKLLSIAQRKVSRAGKNSFAFWKYIDYLSTIDADKYKRHENMILDDTPWIDDSKVTLPTVPKGFHENRPRIHIGTIASGNTVVKDSKVRDFLVENFPDIMAVEMESSGVADASWLEGKDCFVIRGICDYCNPSKTKEWQEYAAGVASAFAKEIIEAL